VVIPNGIDFKAVRDCSALPPLPSELGLDDPDELIVMVAARLSAEKDIAQLIRAFALVKPALHCRLLVVGEGHARPELERLAAELGLRSRVTFAGYQAPIYPFLWRADIYVHTCEFEGFGYAMLEAMACEAAVIATDCPTGPRELLERGRYGLLVPPGRADALAHAIDALLRSPEQRARLVELGLQRARAYPVDAMVRRFEELFVDLATP
jgi:glycosyltransferase involved in cell wall biosynthesis